jgi:cold shock protein
MPTGTVTWVDSSKDCGFIAPEQGGCDLFVHSSDVSSGSRTLFVGARVDFERRDGRRGRIVAADVVVKTSKNGRPARVRAEPGRRARA